MITIKDVRDLFSRNSTAIDLRKYVFVDKYRLFIELDMENIDTLDNFKKELKTKLVQMPIIKELCADAVRMDNFKRDI